MTVVQLSIDDAIRQREEEAARRDAGIAQAEGRNDALWRPYAYSTLRDIAYRQGTVHVDDLYRALEWYPASPNAMGGIWLRAIREGLIQRTGEYRATTLPGKHAHQYPCYRSLVYGQRAA